MNWYRAELESREGLIPSNYIEMKPHELVYPLTAPVSARLSVAHYTVLYSSFSNDVGNAR